MSGTPNADESRDSEIRTDTEVSQSASPETLILEGVTKHAASTEIEEVAEIQPNPITPVMTSLDTKASLETSSNDHIKPPLRENSMQLSLGEVRDIAKKLYHESFMLVSPEEYTQFLASQDVDNVAIRDCYMNLFEWDASLIKATRKLCLRLYLKGESQEIHRLLSAFTKSYLKQHPVNVFCTQDFEQIYIVLYSLILLNTSLHNSEVNKKSKLSQADYIRNTLTTFLLQNKKTSLAYTVNQKIQIEHELNLYYEDLAKHELYLKKSDCLKIPQRDSKSNRYSVAEMILSTISSNKTYHFTVTETATASTLANKLTALADLCRQPSSNSTVSLDAQGNRAKFLAIKQMSSMPSATCVIHAISPFTTATGHNGGKTSRFGFTRALSENNQRTSVSHSLPKHQSTDHLLLARRTSRSSVTTKESAMTQQELFDDPFSIVSFNDMLQLDLLDTLDEKHYKLEYFDVADFQDPLDLKLELQGAPYLKEGLLKLRILNNDMADNSSSGEANVSSAALTYSLLSVRGGFFSFFLRSSSKQHPVATLGTSSNNVFNNKFTEYFVVVSKGELRLYSFDPIVIKKQQKQQKTKHTKQQHAIQHFENVVDEEDQDIGDGNWLKKAAHIGNYNLCSTVAQFEKNSPSQKMQSIAPQKVHFSLSFPRISRKNPKKFLFEAGTTEVANEFINTCNFWASKMTAVPTLEESMSSIEYGWTDMDGLLKLGDFKKTKTISKWDALPKGVYLSNLSNSNSGDKPDQEGMVKQFVQMLKYYNNLKLLFNSFSRQKAQFIKYFRKFSHSSNYKLVMQNYENRAEEYKNELIKYKSYITILGYGLKLRFDLENDEQMDAWAEEILELPGMDAPNALSIELARRKKQAAGNESELKKAVKLELEKLIQSSVSMKKLIAQKAKVDYHEASELQDTREQSDGFLEQEFDTATAPLVKSPKTFSLAQFEDTESSPISQLLSADRNSIATEHEPGPNQALITSHSANTITEEEEPED